MGRPPWASEEQIVFLESRLEGLELAKKTHGLNTEYAIIAGAFLERWPAKPSDKDREETSDPQKLQTLAGDRRRKVSHRSIHFSKSILTTLPANL